MRRLTLLSFAFALLLPLSVFSAKTKKAVYVILEDVYKRQSVSIADSTATLQNESAGTFGKLYRTGITMNLLNPKIILFFLAFFPQFLDKTSATPRIDILILGTTFAAVAITIFTIVALVADWVSARFGARQIPPATLAWIRAGVYWTIAMLFLFY